MYDDICSQLYRVHVLQHGEQLVRRDDVVGSMESVTEALVTHTLQSLDRITAGMLAKVSVAECSLVCILSGGSFVQVLLAWELHYQCMKKSKTATVAQSKYASSNMCEL
jgi:hypothetical protein